MPTLCPGPERLAEILRAAPASVGDADLAAHLTECSACQSQLGALAGDPAWIEANARKHATSGAAKTPEALQQAMQALESRLGASQQEAPSPPKLDFLERSDQAGVLGRCGPYEVLAHVASGGMGIVLKARDPALDRIVALKILSPALATNSLARARFVREARAAAAVVHEHVVPVYAVDEFAGLPYLVMQFVKGRSLSERLRASGPLRLEEILRIGAQVAAGLAAAHAQGLVHRDIKPGNILLENSVERVKLTDFGLARAADDAGLTRTGEVAGTPEFMAPEQASGQPVDHRADLFSLGSVMYAMCSGGSPFQGTSVVGVIRKVCDEQPRPVSDVNPAIPRWLSDIIGKLMAKAPEDRIQSARDIGALLERHLARVQHSDPGAPFDYNAQQETTDRRRRLVYTLGMALLLIATGSSIWILRHADSVPIHSQPGSNAVPFVVRNTSGRILGSYTDVSKAIRAAPSAGIVEMNWNGLRRMPAVRLAAKPLTLRSGAKYRPIWLHTNASEAALASDAALTLEGIDFVWNPSGDNAARDDETVRSPSGRPRANFGSRRQGLFLEPSSSGLITISNGSLKISHCILRLEGPNHMRLEGTCVTLENTKRCEFENTAFHATPGKAFVWRPKSAGSTGEQASLSLSNCVVNGGPAFWMDLPQDSRPDLEIVRCTFLGPNLLILPPSASTGEVVVLARNNLFAAGSLLRDIHKIPSALLTGGVTWRDDENLFRPSQGYVFVASSPRPVVTTLADWNKWWKQTNENSREVEVSFVTGRRDAFSGARPERKLSNFMVADLQVMEGPPLDRNQWGRFGADITNVGPASPE